MSWSARTALVGIVLGSGSALADEDFFPIPCNDNLTRVLSEDMGDATDGLTEIVELINDRDFDVERKSIRWFGVLSANDLGAVKGTLESALAIAGAVQFLCVPQVSYYDVGDHFTETIAYVYSEQPLIYVLGNYFELASDGLDSRAGALVHELTHLQFVAGTNGLPPYDQETYDMEDVLELAQDDRKAALANAQSYAYFFEDVLYGIVSED